MRCEGLPSLARSTSSFKVEASGGQKIKTEKPYGNYHTLRVSPIFNTDEWSPSGDVYVGGTSHIHLTLKYNRIGDLGRYLTRILSGGALLVYNTSVLAQ
ncbi:hypothetical protein F3Y22_tig00110345pilonHSYRG00017 [Hibiscus syriacus]|uniref:Photosystem II 10 kDa polypeptide, chloroplastic n=1 Tax=Hibiscus syriacus TaxID=106335 RepID=A0A6A3AZX5_HIBSY|nr:hypothetical protein F3Y22_tig00110345pilonHSYRG00017 [Hibiscus syriacus]